MSRKGTRGSLAYAEYAEVLADCGVPTDEWDELTHFQRMAWERVPISVIERLTENEAFAIAEGNMLREKCRSEHHKEKLRRESVSAASGEDQSPELLNQQPTAVEKGSDEDQRTAITDSPVEPPPQ